MITSPKFEVGDELVSLLDGTRMKVDYIYMSYSYTGTFSFYYYSQTTYGRAEETLIQPELYDSKLFAALRD